jgi:hypothetical protein
MKAGDSLPTVYGSAILCNHREVDDTYVLDLPFGRLYANRETIRRDAAAAATCESTTTTNATTNIGSISSSSSKSSMKLNEAYEALEKMRLLNLEVTCQERGIPFICLEATSSSSCCTTCLLLSTPRSTCKQGTNQSQQPPPQQQPLSSSFLQRSVRFPRFSAIPGADHEKTAGFSGLVKKIQNLDKNRSRNNNINKGAPCLLCGSPVCSTHASKTFKQQGNIDVCLSCEGMFGMDFILDCLTSNNMVERRQKVDRLLDSYDRTLLLLQYSCQFIDDIGTCLEQDTARHNTYVGVGGSSAGMVSGVLGMAAAATILTPAGPPLLLASLLFGGGATAVQTGAEIKNRYFSEPQKLADRIIALHAMLQAILRMVGMLRDALLGDDFCRSRIMCLQENDDTENNATNFAEFINKTYENNKTGILASATVGSLGMAGLEIGGQLSSAASATAEVGTTWAGLGSNLLRTARLARFAGGALSAATLVCEARCMTRTIAEIRAGNPCEKAQQLRRIKQQVLNDNEQHDNDDDAYDYSYFPSSSCLDSECKRYLQALNQRERFLTQEEAVRLLLETAVTSVAEELQDEEEGQFILTCSPNPDDVRVESVMEAGTFKQRERMDMSASLLERIERFKERQNGTRQATASSTSLSSTSKYITLSSSSATSSSSVSAVSSKSPSPPLRSGESHDNDNTSSNASSLKSASLLQRIEMFKLRQQAVVRGEKEYDDYDLSDSSLPRSDCNTVPLNIL